MCQVDLLCIKKSRKNITNKIFNITKIKSKNEYQLDGYSDYDIYSGGSGCCCASIIGSLQAQDDKYAKILKEQREHIKMLNERIDKLIARAGKKWTEYNLEIEPIRIENRAVAKKLDEMNEDDENYIELLNKHNELIKEIFALHDKYPMCVDIVRMQEQVLHAKNFQNDNKKTFYYWQGIISRILSIVDSVGIFTFWKEAGDDCVVPVAKIHDIMFKDFKIESLTHLKYGDMLLISK